MSSQAEYNFADWYRPVDSQLTADKQGFRIAAIKELLGTEDMDFWLDVIRIFIGLPVNNPDSKQEFIRAFKDADPVFPVSGNDHILQVLAGILLCFQFEEDFYFNNSIALAINTVNFLGQYGITSSIPVTSIAKAYLLKQSKELRAIDLEAQQEDIDALISRNKEAYAFVAKDHTVLTTAINSLLKSQKVFSEETNILWWLFGEASQTYEEPFKTLGMPKAIPIIAKEVFDLIEFSLANQKINSIINKAISNCATGKGVDKEFSPLEVIGKFTTDEIHILLGSFKPKSEFTPILTAFSQFANIGKSADWPVLYAAEFNGGDLKKLFSASKIASQILNELFLLFNLK